MNGFLLQEMSDHQTSTWHVTQFVALPVGCASVRATVSPAVEFRESPLLACELRLVFRNADGVQIPGSGCGLAARTEFAPDEPTPITGHETGQMPGVFPAAAGAFAYVMEDSLGVEQVPYGTTAGVEFRLSHHDEVFVSAAVTLEAFDSHGLALEIV